MERITLSQTSLTVRVRMEVEPNSVLHTSPEIFEEAEKTLTRRYPKARAATEIMAMAASPLIFAFFPLLRRRIALITVTGRISSISFVRFMTVATDMAPKATWERPSPMKEKRRRTRVTPRSAEQSATSTETIRAYRTKGYCRYIPNFAIIPPLSPS